ncbi:MAG: CBS domain-containing protein [Anaerolineaceae bacterium]|nr:CBS domain-containing protein [Anaerolineaceae bacterium]
MRDSQFDNTPPRFKGKVITDELAGSITRVEELAYILKISEVMTREVKTLRPQDTMRNVMDVMREYRISGVPIVDEAKNLIGLVSTEDLIKCLANQDIDKCVKDYMTTDLVTVNSFDHLTEGLKLFAKTKLGRLPVLGVKGELVGILTKGDVTYGILRALEHDYQEEEVRKYRASHLFEDIESTRTSLILRYEIKRYDFTNGGAASSNIKRALVRLGANPQLARRVGIAIYEAEMNLIIHTTNGGSIHVEIEPNQIAAFIWDDGPGIKDINLAMQPGYSTATEEIRELGFGAGMGLSNISRCVDQMELKSDFGKGTHLTLKFLLKGEDIMGEGHLNKKEDGDDA